MPNNGNIDIYGWLLPLHQTKHAFGATISDTFRLTSTNKSIFDAAYSICER